MKKACSLIEQCQFLIQNEENMPKLRNLFRERYCLGSFDQCARYQVGISTGLKNVPEFMLPTQNEWACQIIQEIKLEQIEANVSQPS